jgi:dynein heavy chain, axonemal
MQSLYAPILLNNTTWPDTIRKDVHAATHKFLSALVQGIHAKRGNTILYLPSIDTSISLAAAAKDKELLQLLETCVIHATRQVKDVLNKQDDLSHSDGGGPLAEIDFWRLRSADLTHICSQLDAEKCGHIVKVRLRLMCGHKRWKSISIEGFIILFQFSTISRCMLSLNVKV